jgi:hypothetical protein
MLLFQEGAALLQILITSYHLNIQLLIFLGNCPLPVLQVPPSILSPCKSEPAFATLVVSPPLQKAVTALLGK